MSRGRARSAPTRRWMTAGTKNAWVTRSRAIVSRIVSGSASRMTTVRPPSVVVVRPVAAPPMWNSGATTRCTDSEVIRNSSRAINGM